MCLGTPAFAGMTEREGWNVSEADFTRRTYADGEVIFRDGERGGEAFLVEKGEVRLSKVTDGAEVEIDLVRRKAIFGEMAVISDQNRMATATAVGPVTVIVVGRAALQGMLRLLTPEWKQILDFLIYYCADFLPYELQGDRPADGETQKRDAKARKIAAAARNGTRPPDLDPFVTELYKRLVDYAERRLPPT